MGNKNSTEPLIDTIPPQTSHDRIIWTIDTRNINLVERRGNSVFIDWSSKEHPRMTMTVGFLDEKLLVKMLSVASSGQVYLWVDTAAKTFYWTYFHELEHEEDKTTPLIGEAKLF